ncbi:MAG TPA: hypothetical protein DET40_12315 [Lentisphaeria bacterium]|nr:hypothetical protein [Lentisphaeria bacterium]
MINDLLSKMMSLGASDLFVSAGKVPYARINTSMRPLDAPVVTADEIESFRTSILVTEVENKYQQTGSVDTGFSFGGSRYRINFLLQQAQPGFVARLVPSGALEFSALNLPKVLSELAERPRGLVLIVGAAGSGKSTTMAAMLNHINETFNKHIVTIEDPIEFVHRDKKCLVTQREIGSDTADFAEALKNVVRESPDVIFIGEMRDLETMQIAISAALTGHLVISTVHTANVIQSIERIVNNFPEHLREQASADLALALEGIVAQRLVPRADGGGMVPAVEILKATPLVKRVIEARNYSDLEDLIKRGYEEGMQTFARALADLCKAGKITLASGSAASTNHEEFVLLVQGMESGVDMFRDTLEGETQDEKTINMKRLLHSAVSNGASDLIITAGHSPCLRINGELNPLATEPLSPSDTKRLLFSVLNAKQREIFEERREVDFALSVNVMKKNEDGTVDSSPFRFRVNGFYQRGSVASAIRVIPKRIPPPEELGLPKTLVNMMDKHQGLILITGPTGHGKSTTMASLINRINETRACHIITVEDPIEYVHGNKKAVIEQREVYADTLSFANALKYVLRQDPDVILVGEMRDTETIGAALTAAETGHLVLATLHTNDAAQSIDRIIDSFPAHQQNQIRLQLSGTVLGIVAQRLLPRRDGKGRVAAFEVLVGTPAIRATIREGKSHLIASIIETMSKDGMITMDKALKELYTSNQVRRQDAASLMATQAN